MDLYIVRHGEALPGADDAARRLSARGRVEVEQVAEAAKRRGAAIQRIRHSSRVRACETAEIMAAVFEPPAGMVETPGLHPDDPVEPTAHALFGERESTMLVGHLPFVARLVGLLTAGSAHRSPVSFPTATLACLRGQDDCWELAWTESPS